MGFRQRLARITRHPDRRLYIVVYEPWLTKTDQLRSCQTCEELPRIARMDIKNLDAVPSFTTKDGSEIRELLAHRNSAIRNQSLAEARILPGQATQEHFHRVTEEIYYITHGQGRMRIEGETRE